MTNEWNVYMDKKAIQVKKIAPSIYKTPCYDQVRSDGTNALRSDFSFTFTLDDWRRSETPDRSTD
jgi:phage-related protein